MIAENSNETTTSNKINEAIKNTAIDAANVEKAGAILLSVGYSTFIEASNIDILEALETNTTGITSFDILTLGQRLTLLGYILLYIASSKRLNEKTLANSHEGKKHDLLAFQIVRDSYLGSIAVNYIRLVEFEKLLQKVQER